MERTRAAERGYYGEPDLPRRGGRRPDNARSGARPDRSPAGRPADPRGAAGRAHRGSTAAALEDRGSRLRGAVAVGAVFVLTLAVGAVESFLGTGLGTVTLVALVLTTVLAALLVRRRDLLSVIVSPPLVFVAVAVADVAAAPSASLNLATLATLLIRGFPAMAIATVAALVIGLVRKVRGRR
jgi:hypothetical protein